MRIGVLHERAGMLAEACRRRAARQHEAGAWRMALAQDLLRRGAGSVAEVAERVGYSSASTFTVAFARHVGVPPGRYARAD